MNRVSNSAPRKISIVHHIDNDGYYAGRIAGVAQLAMGNIPVYHAYNYGQPVPEELEMTIVIVDVSFSIEELRKLLDAGKSVIWIDHHITAMNEFLASDLPDYDNMIYLLATGVAACELTWFSYSKLFREYINKISPLVKSIDFMRGHTFEIENWHSSYHPEPTFEDFFDKIPSWVYLTGCYDVWRNDHPDFDTVIMPFQYYQLSQIEGQEDVPMALINESRSKTARYVEMGNAILSYLDAYNRSIHKYAMELEIAGFKVIALNAPSRGSRAFQGLYDPEKHDMMMAWYRHPLGYSASLYSDKEGVHCGDVARDLGGGGHKGAAGFRFSSMDFIDSLAEIK